MLKKATIYGERCSGTNYLEKLLITNFNIDIKFDYGWKHFFGFKSLEGSDDTLFICIVRDPYEWITSFYEKPHHVPRKLRVSPQHFLNQPFYSIFDKVQGKEIKEDRHIYTKERYKNIFELRYTKLNFIQNDLPKRVKNYILIRYEDLLENFETTMFLLENCGLERKQNISFPLNYKGYQKSDSRIFTRHKRYKISKQEIVSHQSYQKNIENKLGYDL